LEWDPVIFPNAKYVVKIAKKGTSVWYHFHLDEETTKLFVPGLEPGTEYKYKICVVAGTVTVECEEHCISTLP
jgi:1,4-alpha-glucan branching enzyme